jgi:hypothetical protein
VPGELVDEGLQQFASAPRDLRGEFPVAKPRAGKTQVAVERVDQDLEARLPRLRFGALLRLGRGAGELFVFQSILAQSPQQGNE